ncbi:MAG: pyridoxal-phosphate dependent enzyme [Chlamydiia bacterium]|nr:pyridoxal-phosphate dependent enzyme [Chlamydiia bacterium]
MRTYPIFAVGGGGLFCGIVQGLKDVGWDALPIFTAETEGASSFAQSVHAKKLVTLETVNTIATSLAAKTIAKQALEDALTHTVFPKIITDQQALNATSHFVRDHRLLVEPACGAALSLVYEQLIDSSQFPTLLVIVCGGNAIANFH